MFALLVAIDPTSLNSTERASDRRERSSAAAKSLRRSLMSARLMSASDSLTLDRDLRARARASSIAASSRCGSSRALERRRCRHARLHHLGRAARSFRESVSLLARLERALRLLQRHVQGGKLIQRAGAAEGVALLLGQRQRILKRPEGFLEVTACARGDADRHRHPVFEALGSAAPLSRIRASLATRRPGGVAGQPLAVARTSREVASKGFSAGGRFAFEAVGERQASPLLPAATAAWARGRRCSGARQEASHRRAREAPRVPLARAWGTRRPDASISSAWPYDRLRGRREGRRTKNCARARNTRAPRTGTRGLENAGWPRQAHPSASFPPRALFAVRAHCRERSTIARALGVVVICLR